MKIKLIRSYKSKAGNTVFVYGVTGTPAQIEAFANAQGENHRVDEKTGAVLWFTTRCVGQSGELIITTNGKIVPDMSAFDQAASLASQYGGNFGDQLAKMAAEKLLGGGSPATTPVVSAPADIAKL
jgi:hypothetical protein